MAAPGRPCTTCALCGGRDAVTRTVLDGRKVPACVVCLSEVVVDPISDVAFLEDLSLAARVVRIARLGRGKTLAQIAAELDISTTSQAYGGVTQALHRAVNDGYLRVEPVGRTYVYYATTVPWEPPRRGPRRSA